jgi:hypothetical protein
MDINYGKARQTSRLFIGIFWIICIGFCIVTFKYFELKRGINEKESELAARKVSLEVSGQQLSNELKSCKADKDALTNKFNECTDKQSADQKVTISFRIKSPLCNF